VGYNFVADIMGLSSFV